MNIKYVKFVDWPAHYSKYKDEVDKAIQDCLERGDLIQREDHDEFEEKFAKYIGRRYCRAVNSGTDAIYLSLWAAGIEPGDEVITVSHTFIATIAAIAQIGAIPVLIDVGEDYLMDTKKIEGALSNRTKVIIPVHYNGRMCDMDKITQIAKENNLIIIEDACQALGVTRPSYNKKAGSYGLTGCFSFYPSKVLPAAGDAGAIVTDDEDMAEKIHLLRDHGRKTKTETVNLGINSRLDNIQAAILNVKLKYLEEFRSRKKEIALRYNKELKDIPQITLVGDSAYENYVIRAVKRDELYKHLKSFGVETQIHEPIPNHKIVEVAKKCRFMYLPMTERLANEVISLPLNPELENSQVDYVIKQIKYFYQKYAIPKRE